MNQRASSPASATRGPAEQLYLVDGPSYLYRAYHAIGHLSTSRGIPGRWSL